ncbi:MAG: zinc-ribbon domain-containing protein [Gudongella sp.]|nr:zinc-ribbon domain-containing protein [Gudongella sp.]
MDNKDNLKRFEKHLVKCPNCGKDVLDHMTECPFCGEKLEGGYRGIDPATTKKIRLVLTVVFLVAAVAIFLLSRL